MLKASQDEAAAVAVAANPTATPEQIKAARATAAASATKETAVAAKTQADTLRTALPAAGTATADQIAGVIAAGTAAYAASLATTDTTAQADAKNAAVAAYNQAVTSGKVPVAAGDGVPPERWAAGMASMQKCKITRGLFDSNNAAPVASMADLLRIATTLEKKTLNLDPTTDFPALPTGGMTQPNETRLDHVLERHTRAYFTFDQDELTPKADLLEGLIAEGALDALPKTYQQQKSINKASAKKTTLFAEGKDKADIKKYIEEAVAELFAQGTAVYADVKNNTTIAGGVLTYLHTEPNKQFGQYKGVPAKDGLKFTIGLNNKGNHYKIDQFYPEPLHPSLESLNPADMHTAKETLGV